MNQTFEEIMNKINPEDNETNEFFMTEHIKELIKLKEKKYRDLSNTFLIEGRHLVLEAHREKKIVELILEQEIIY